MITRRTFSVSLAALAATMGTRASAMVSLDQLSAYFNDLVTARATFRQFNDDGSQSTGTLYIRRPGRARFEYDPPDEALVMAGGGHVAIFDGRSNSKRPEQYPLRRTPLNLILERQVDLGNRNMVVGHVGDDTHTKLVAQDPKAPENGQIEIVFTNDPIALAEWTIIDGGGARTRVILDGMETGLQFPSRLFNIVLEQESRGG
ncbi:MAG: outer membrane lipoprotein carrier protein LolA [Pseudomonadota bacterium]